uniref:LamG domain-containing protein n=1 Tax=candidate division CPR3 bacterium TaxID=2268181 RepID=A0A7C4M2Q7_UNCC3
MRLKKDNNKLNALVGFDVKNKRPSWFFVLLISFLIILLFALGFLIINTRAAFSEQINYQGRLTNSSGSPVTDGSYSFVFSLCTDSGGVTCPWTESKSITTSKGLFSTMLGSTNSFGSLDFNQELWLKVSVEGTTLSPLKKLGAAPASFESKQLRGKTWESPGTIGSTTPNTGKFTTLESTTGDDIAFTFSGNAPIVAFTGTGISQITTATDQSFAIMPGGTGKVGIGANSGLSALLNVSIASGSTPGLYVNNLGSGYSFRVDDESSDSTPFIVDSSGNVGIGTASPAATLHVSNAAPEIRITDSSNSEYTRIIKSDTNNAAGRYNRIHYGGADTYTKLLLHANGSQGSTTFTDDGNTGHTVTVGGNTNINTTIKKFGTGSGYFDGNGDYLQIPANSDFDFGSENFTIDFWAYHTNDGREEVLFRHQNAWNDGIAIIKDRSGTSMWLIVYFSGSGQISDTSIATPDPNQWNHYALIRNGSNLYFAVNGVLTTVSSSISGNVGPASGYPFNIGYALGSASDFTGYMDEFRVSKGVARWTANFTPPSIEYDSSVSSDEVNVWKSEDSDDPTEKGIQTYGDSEGRTIVDGANIRFNIGGTEKMRIDSTGKLGIGISSPTKELHLHKPSASDVVFMITNSFTGSTNTDGSSIGVSESGHFAIQNNENTDMYFNTNTQERMRIKNDGKIGMGVTIPLTKLHLEGTTSDDSSLTLEGNSTTDNYSSIRFLRSRGSNVSKSAVVDTDKLGLVSFNGYNSSSNYVSGAYIFSFVDGTPGATNIPAKITFYTGTSGSYPTERMVIKSSGYVGIGTTDPQSTLHVPDGKYAQFEDNNAGAPPSADCDSNTERGRISIDTTNNRLYICNGATRGWDYIGLTD